MRQEPPTPFDPVFLRTVNSQVIETDGVVRAAYVRADGELVFVLDDNSGTGGQIKVKTQALSTPWSAVTGSPTGSLSFTVSDPASGFSGIDFNAAGTRMFLFNHDSTKVYYVDTMTPWSFSSATLSSFVLPTSSLSLTDSPFYIFDETGAYSYANAVGFVDRVVRLQSNSAFDPDDTGTTTTTNFTSDIGGGASIQVRSFAESGTYMYGNVFSSIRRWTLSTPYDLNTKSNMRSSLDFSSSFYGFKTDPTGTKALAYDSNTEQLVSYSMGV